MCIVMDSSESNHTPRSRTASQEVIGTLGRVVRVRNRMNSVFVGLSCRRREEKDFCRSLIQAVRLLMRTGILDIGQWYGMVY